MLRIAICDDDQSSAAMLRSSIERHLSGSFNLTIGCFHSGERLLEEYQSEKAPFDIILLDVEMKGINGIETAKRIRASDKNAAIVFLTAYNNYAIEGYDAKASKYILKTEPEPVIIRKIKEVINDYKNRKATLIIRSKSGTHAVKIDSIVYAEVLNRVVTIHTLNREYSYYSKLMELEKELSGFSFVRACKSYLINLTYVESVEKDHAVMANNEKIHVSRKYRADVENKFLNYMVSERNV